MRGRKGKKHITHHTKENGHHGNENSRRKNYRLECGRICILCKRTEEGLDTLVVGPAFRETLMCATLAACFWCHFWCYKGLLRRRDRHLGRCGFSFSHFGHDFGSFFGFSGVSVLCFRGVRFVFQVFRINSRRSWLWGVPFPGPSLAIFAFREKAEA